MNEPVESLIARLRTEYLHEVPSRLEGIRVALDAVLEGHDPNGDAPRVLFHRLAGSAGAYGFGEVTARCREADRLLAGAEPAAKAVPALRALVEEIEAAFAAGPTSHPIAP